MHEHSRFQNHWRLPDDWADWYWNLWKTNHQFVLLLIIGKWINYLFDIIDWQWFIVIDNNFWINNFFEMCKLYHRTLDVAISHRDVHMSWRRLRSVYIFYWVIICFGAVRSYVPMYMCVYYWCFQSNPSES